MRRGGNGSATLDVAQFRFRGQRYAYLSLALEPPDRAAALTSAELDVAWRAANGQSYKQIAEARGSSVHTVANQLTKVFAKLGIQGRHQLAAAFSREPQ